METIFNFICLHAHQAHWILFLLLMLAGLNVPISEDILLLTAGAIANTCIPEQTYHLLAWVLMGCWLSAWEAYWIGRYFGPKLYNIHWFSRIITPARIAKLHDYYEKFGVFTFIVGRFIPGGVRNALFISTGLGRMPFLKFILRDGVACCIAPPIIFSIGYYFAENYQAILYYFKTYNKIALGFFIFILLIAGIFLWRKKVHDI